MSNFGGIKKPDKCVCVTNVCVNFQYSEAGVQKILHKCLCITKGHILNNILKYKTLILFDM